MLNSNLANVKLHYVYIEPLFAVRPFYLYELTLGYVETVLNNGSIIMTIQTLNIHEGLGGHAKDGRCM